MLWEGWRKVLIGLGFSTFVGFAGGLAMMALKPVEDLSIPDLTQPSVLTVIQQEEMSTCVQRYVAKLSDTYKAVLLMCDADGLSANETAELLQLPLTTVKMRLHRARRQMHSALREACEFERDERGVFVCEPKRDKQ